MINMKYNEGFLRTNLKSGDVVFVYPSPKSSLLDKFISFWENPFKEAPFHAGIILREKVDLYVLQADPDGAYQVPLSYYKNNKLEIFSRMYDVPFDVEWAENYFKHIKYDYIGAGLSAVAEYIPSAAELDKSHKKFCSQAVIDTYTHMGYKFNTDCVDPYVLAKYFYWLEFNKLVVNP